MTTIIASPNIFIAGDAMWTSQVSGFEVECETRKHIVCNEQVVFFSGDEHPIILAQAVLLSLISDEEYLQLAEALDERDEIGLIALTEHAGALIDMPIGNNANTGELIFTGSGGFHAATFYQDLDNLSCLLKRIDTAMTMAFQVDEQSGNGIHKKVWPKHYDNLCYTDTSYQECIVSKIQEYHEFIAELKSMEGDNMAAKLPRSTNRTAPAPNAPKATPERMKEILEALRKNQTKQTEKQEESA
ncbi:RIPOR family protein [Vibrio chagasii]|uniref:RIPOR family protein n=1 Tax=Vibrio chagasii TaxID=170679 RepID=UPI001EFE94ED|nr:RIPOR family protein [Vibrio chagasii]